MIAAALRLGGALSGLATYRQFLLYKVVPGKDKPQKFPCSPMTGAVVDAHDRQHWVDAETALAAAEAWGMHVAFVLTADDPFWFLDIDHAYADGQWSETATALCQYFNGAAMEVSTSGAGLHILGRGVAPAHGTRNGALGLEFYTARRFIALTGTNAAGSVDGADWTAHLAAFVPTYFPAVATTEAPLDWTTQPRPEWRGPADDDELVARALRARASAASAFSGRATFKELWEADADALSRAIPDKARPYDASSADMQLALHLAWWTGGNCERIERLMRKSGLVREKWDTHATYLREFTIRKAVAMCKSCYVETPAATPAAPVAAPTGPESQLRSAVVQWVDPAGQREYFKGCVYVTDANKVMVPNGMLLDQSQFNGTYGGYMFKLDDANTKTSNKPWDAFVMSLANTVPRVDSTYFNPRHPPRAVTQIGGLNAINTWVPAFGQRKAGDPKPFLDLVERMIPDRHDQRILLAYLAACVQNPGIKFKWAVVLQGVEGNGKSTIADCLAHAVGERYVHRLRSSKLTAQFTAWMERSLLAVVDDVKIDAREQEKILEELKPMITGDKREIEVKFGDSKTRDVFFNFIFTMNDKAGIRKTKNDRRYCVFFTDQQESDDLERCGMTEAYFYDLNAWLKRDGYAIVADYLATVAIPDELNPATRCVRAPRTSKIEDVFESGLSGAAAILRDEIQSSRQGMRGGFVSSQVARTVLIEHGFKSIGPKGIASILGELGYDKLRQLPDGRFAGLTTWDNGIRPVVYLLRGHPAWSIYEEAPLWAAYMESQRQVESASGKVTSITARVCT